MEMNNSTKSLETNLPTGNRRPERKLRDLKTLEALLATTDSFSNPWLLVSAVLKETADSGLVTWFRLALELTGERNSAMVCLKMSL